MHRKAGPGNCSHEESVNPHVNRHHDVHKDDGHDLVGSTNAHVTVTAWSQLLRTLLVCGE